MQAENHHFLATGKVCLKKEVGMRKKKLKGTPVSMQDLTSGSS